jgi:hypothetical protein
VHLVALRIIESADGRSGVWEIGEENVSLLCSSLPISKSRGANAAPRSSHSHKHITVSHHYQTYALPLALASLSLALRTHAHKHKSKRRRAPHPPSFEVRERRNRLLRGATVAPLPLFFPLRARQLGRTSPLRGSTDWPGLKRSRRRRERAARTRRHSLFDESARLFCDSHAARPLPPPSLRTAPRFCSLPRPTP